jgi:hypothetical protein
VGREIRGRRISDSSRRENVLLERQVWEVYRLQAVLDTPRVRDLFVLLVDYLFQVPTYHRVGRCAVFVCDGDRHTSSKDILDEEETQECPRCHSVASDISGIKGCTSIICVCGCDFCLHCGSEFDSVKDFECECDEDIDGEEPSECCLHCGHVINDGTCDCGEDEDGDVSEADFETESEEDGDVEMEDVVIEDAPTHEAIEEGKDKESNLSMALARASVED